MTKMKKLVSLLLAALMLLSMLSVASADDETYSITITNTVSGYEYYAYQIFTGDYSDGVLSNVEWGSGINSDDFIADLKASETFVADFTKEEGETYSAQDIADILGEHQNAGSVVADLIADNLKGNGAALTEQKDNDNNTTGYSYTCPAAGYYFVKNTVVPTSVNGTAYSNYILQVLGAETLTPKASVPTLVKKVKDANDTDGTTTDWQDSADYDIGDNVPFQLTATLPSHLDDYDTYSLTFHDTLDAGLTLVKPSLTVYVFDKDGNRTTVKSESSTCYVVTENVADGHTFDVVITDVKSMVEAVTDEKIIEVEAGYTIQVVYSATLNSTANIGATGNDNKAYLTYSNNPNDEGTGTTPVDQVTVFTYQLTVNKVDGEGNPLADAKFTLYKWSATENAYVEYADELAATTVKGDAADPEKVTDYIYNWKGLDDGRYKLVETTTPAGYNTAADIVFTITATHDVTADDPELESITVNNDSIAVESDSEGELTGVLSTEVVNNSGATLPSTGGIGTTIFYAVGGLLVVLAVVLLVTKRRVGEEK